MIFGFIIFFLICLFLTFTYCKENKSIFNHFSIFNLGFTLYLIMPMIIGESGLLKDSDLFSTFNYLYDRISDTNKILYFLFLLLIYFGYVYGIIIYKKKIKKNDHKTKKLKIENLITVPFENKTKRKNIVCLILIFISFIYIYKFFPYFFKGYYSGDINRGGFAAFMLIYFSYLIFYDIEIYKDTNSFRKTIFNIFTIWFVLLNILLLSLGTRMYFIACLFIILSLIDVFYNFDKKKILIGILCVFILVGLIGILRSGYQFNIKNSILINSMEFLYTFISSLKFMELGIFKIFNIPKFILSDFVNLVPSFILPNKLSYILDPNKFGYIIYSPEGALSAYVDLMINFGLLGSILFMMFFGYMMEYLNNNKKKILLLVIYVMICGFIGFSFFRDGFITSIIKNIFEFSILIPILYYLIFKFRFKGSKLNEEEKNNITN